MGGVEYIVAKDGNRWMINLQGDQFGPYETQRDAIQAAVEAAHTSGDQGYDAKVLVPVGINQFRTEWTYGHDQYPTQNGLRGLKVEDIDQGFGPLRSTNGRASQNANSE